MKIKQVLNCALPAWYPDFKNVTIKSRILDIPDDFLEYLCSDGTVVLPKGSFGHAEYRDTEQASDDEVVWDDDSSDEAKCPSFPVFESQIKRSIQGLGGAVFPKLNWSSPKDATWIACNSTLKCTSPGDMYLLLKSSEFITHDLTQPFIRCDDYDSSEDVKVHYKLILRRWHDLNPGGEFRCFVKNGKIIGISQRHSSSHFHFIGSHRQDIVLDMLNFYNRAIKGKFPDPDFVIDVYRKDKERVYLVDFNPFGPVTDALLFTWEELKSNTALTGTVDDGIISDLPAFRFTTSVAGVQPSPYMSYGIPQDFVDLSTGSDPLKLIDFLQLQIQTQNQEDSSSDDEEPGAVAGGNMGNT